MSAVCLYGNRESVDLGFTQDNLLYETGESGFYLDKLYDHTYAATPEFVLPKGLYTVEVQYERSDRSAAEIEVQYVNEQHNEYDNGLSGKIILVDSVSVSRDFRIKYSDRPIQVRGSLTPDAAGEDYILIKNIHIVSSTVNMRNILFCLLTVFLAIDLLLLLYNLRDKFRIFGASIQASYQFYVLLVNAATVLLSYYCFKGMSNANTGLACYVIYTLNIYRLVCVNTRAAVGEYFPENTEISGNEEGCINEVTFNSDISP